MNYTTAINQQILNGNIIGSLDHAAPQEQMKAIGTAFQKYFEATDWLKKRDRKQGGAQLPANILQ